jgi:hypothetical protein
LLRVLTPGSGEIALLDVKIAQERRARDRAQELSLSPGEPEIWFGRAATPMAIGAAAAALCGLWWFLLGQLAWWKPGFVRGVFRPFADHYRGWSGLALSLAGIVLLCGGLLFLV